MAHLATYLDLESLEIQRSSFDFKSNLTSAIGNLANRDVLTSYVSRHNVMAYDSPAIKLSNFFLLQTSFLVLDHVYIYYMTSHIKFGWKILPTTKVMEYNITIQCF